MTSSNTSDRFGRQTDLVPRDALRRYRVSVIGVGAVGRQVALQLAAMGVNRLQIFDFDIVEPTNITSQGYTRYDLGQLKVEATKQAIQLLDPDIEVLTLPHRFRPQDPVAEVVFCCVDSITARTAIWRMLKSRCQFWCDGRMLAETVRVLAAAGQSDREYYTSTLFSARQANIGRCTARSTIYTANICAGLMLQQFTRFLRRQPLDRDLSLNLAASELVSL